jgi:ribosomal protein L40E
MKGQKICDACGTSTGPRAFICKKCNTPFTFKVKSKEQKNTKIIRDINWRELQKGDRIKVSGGPYFVSRGDFIPMGYRGRFIVDSIDQYGIKAWGSDKNTGFAHIWMAGDIQNKETGVWKTAHKLIKLKNKEQTV